MQKKYQFLVIVLALFAVSFCGVASQRKSHQSASRVLRTVISGRRLGTSFGPYYDAKTGYYLTGIVDGLGRPMVAYLILRPDFAPLESHGLSREDIKQKSLSRLRKGKGINIGDSPQQVRQKIGRNAHQSYHNPKTKALTYIYRAAISLKVDNEMQNGWDYKATYTFRRDKLRSIEYEARMHIPKGYDEMGNRLR